MTDHVEGETAKEISWHRHGTPKSLKTVRLRSLFVLRVAQEGGFVGLSASEIAVVLSKKFRLPTSQQAVRGAFNGTIGETVEVIDRPGGVAEYRLLPAGLGLVSPEPVENHAFSNKEIIVPPELFEGTWGFLKKIVFQINGCYRDQYWDACATMLRRLFETLLIEIYESQGREALIKKADGDYLSLGPLIDKAIGDGALRLTSGTRRQLPKIKLYGDTGAHARRNNLRRNDIDRYRDEIRLCAEELVGRLPATGKTSEKS